jgi:hypothetical protein
MPKNSLTCSPAVAGVAPRLTVLDEPTTQFQVAVQRVPTREEDRARDAVIVACMIAIEREIANLRNESHALWLEHEAIKNRNGGIPPR